MSHIPSSAMPHAKAHESAPEPAPAIQQAPSQPRSKPFPWLALAIGGALAAGTALTVASVLRRPAKPAKRNTSKRSTGPRKPRAKKADA
ncbi:hypothetical protein [Sphingomonas bacterium]|uniref:hypothetical protein n=1 Tax=Sphingomonas bacterium TaxID=1895847 RepID=UPI00157636B3|nr:hypothetical protein [Sphingomonas bacterium]